MKRGNTKVKNEKYWSKLVIGAICMMAVATVPTRVNAETLPEEKDTIESEMADLQEDIVLESNEVVEAQDDLQTPEESENPVSLLWWWWNGNRMDGTDGRLVSFE